MSDEDALDTPCDRWETVGGDAFWPGFLLAPWRSTDESYASTLSLAGPISYRPLPRRRHRPTPAAPHGWLLVFPWEGRDHVAPSRAIDELMRCNRGQFSVTPEENRRHEEDFYRDSFDTPTVVDDNTLWRLSPTFRGPGRPPEGSTDLEAARALVYNKWWPCREKAIERLLLEDFNTQTIADALKCSRRTVQRVAKSLVVKGLYFYGQNRSQKAEDD